MIRNILFALLLILCATYVSAMETATFAIGEKLFQDNSLGTNNKSCATCHPDGKGLEESDTYDDSMLKEMVNFCIRDALKGEMRALDSTEINSFLIYLRAFEK